LRSIADPSQNRPQSGAQFSGVKRLGKVIVRAKLEPKYSIHIRPARRQQQHRNQRRSPQLAQHVQPVHLRHHDVKHNDVRVAGLGPRQPSLAVVYRFYLEALGLQVFADQSTKLNIVVNYQDSIHKRL
jgi:hypothetical protein